MRVLCTSDWQTKKENLPRTEQVAETVLKLCKKYLLDAVVVLGDIKHNYNPIDYAVIQFWTGFVKAIQAIGVAPILLLGNHDRVSLYSDDRNWLPILGNAGASVHWKAGVISFGKGLKTEHSRLFILPFVGTKERWEEADKVLLAEKSNPQRDVLVFHQTLVGSLYNKTGVKAKDEPNKSIPLSAIHPARYRYCIGGDIHLHQQIGPNTWYVGSPFPMDWGEANQEKVFALITEKGLEWITTGMPSWYDPSVKGFKAPKSWDGTRVRIKVPVIKGDDYGAKLAEAKMAATLKYVGAAIETIPEVIEVMGEADEKDISKLSEQEQIRSYIAGVWPEPLAEYREVAVSYVESQLRAIKQGFRTDSGIKFSKVWATHCLSFDEVELDLSVEGLTIVTGENKDRPGTSNGSGKTNLLNLILLALFGKTIKGQNFDGWIQRGWDGTATVGAEWTTANNETVQVERSRNPTEVHLWVNGVEVSAGGKSTDVTKDVERLCGFSWDMLVSLMYISREEQTFLWGTQKQKQETLARLQNIERFGLALKLVNAENKQTVRQKEMWWQEIELVRSQIAIKKTQATFTTEAKRVKQELENTRKEIAAIQIPDIEPLQAVLTEAENKSATAAGSLLRLNAGINEARRRFQELTSLPDNCPTCGQKLPRDKKAIEAKIKEMGVEIERLRGVHSKRQIESLALDVVYKECKAKYNEASHKKSGEESRKLLLQREEKKQLADLERWKDAEKDHQSELNELAAKEKVFADVVGVLVFETEFLNLVESILSRDGLPAYISRMLCPKLNRAAEYYSELFTGGEIQVRFDMNDGEVEVEVINPTGGAELTDQSGGEGALATLVTSFALREVAPRTNFLVLDEPGDGLDSSNARAFASGVKQMKGTFGTVFLITHSDSIMSELADVRELRVVKENGVSSVEEVSRVEGD